MSRIPRIPTALLKAVVSARAPCDCAIRSGPSALTACARLARASARASTAGHAGAVDVVEKGVLNITFDYQYQCPRPQGAGAAQHLAVDVAKKCLASARLRCAAAADTLEDALGEECVGLCCFEDCASQTTHLAAANNVQVWTMSIPSGAEGSAVAHDDEDNEEELRLGSGNSIGDAIVLGLAAALRITSWKDEYFEGIPGLSVVDSHANSPTTSTATAASAGTPTQHPIDDLLEGRVQHVVFGLRGWDHACLDMPLPPGTVVFPGSFNPLHYGHRGAVAAATATLCAHGESVPGHAYEISAEHPDKGLLRKEDIRTRVEQFVGVAPVIVSRAALYVAKTERYQGSRLLVGTDVMRKILHPKYSGGSMARMNAELERMRARGCRFLVVGRKDDASGAFETAESVIRDALPSLEDQTAVRDMFIPIEGFRADVSSSAIRAAKVES